MFVLSYSTLHASPRESFAGDAWRADYHLLVYGSLTFDEGYVKKCRALVEELGIQANVELRGLGKPTDVLAHGWCYLQVRCHPSLLSITL